MILDTRALAAIFFNEPEAANCTKMIHDADCCRINASNLLELCLVLDGQIGSEAVHCDLFLRRAGGIIEPFTLEQAYLARHAFHEFGRRRHPAGLNFGDCFAYALAKHTGEPLLFKGNDFKLTDILSAV